MAKSKKKNAHGKSQALPAELQAKFVQALELHRQGDLQPAAQVYQSILQVYPKHADSLHLLGLVAKSAGDLSQSIELIRAAIKVSPKVAPYHYNLGVALQESDDLKAAVDAYRCAIRLDAKNSAIYENLGVALLDSGDYRAANLALEQAISLDSKSVVALRNLASLKFRLGETESSLKLYEQALALAPEDASLRLSRSEVLLRMGRFAEAWSEYEWRYDSDSFLTSNVKRQLPIPRWDEKSLGVHVLVTQEQGLGDEILFGTVLRDLVAEVKQVSLECDPRLVDLMRRSCPELQSVIPRGEASFETFDAYIPIASLPGRYRSTAGDFSDAACGYLAASDSLRQKWKNWLGSVGPGLKVGVSWRGGIERRASTARSVDARYWKDLASIEGIKFVNLQYAPTTKELKTYQAVFEEKLIDPEGLDVFNDIDSLAALVTELDLIISVSNTTVHLAGALGVPTWVLLPAGPAGRWLDGRSRAIWYESVKMFRSPSIAEKGWQQVLGQVALDLKAIEF